FFPARKVPQFEGFVLASRQRGAAVGCDRNRVNRSSVPLECADQIANARACSTSHQRTSGRALEKISALNHSTPLELSAHPPPSLPRLIRASFGGTFNVAVTARLGPRSTDQRGRNLVLSAFLAAQAGLAILRLSVSSELRE